MPPTDSIPDIVIAERLVKLETVVEAIDKKQDEQNRKLDAHIQSQNNLFYRYGWPLVQVLIWIAIVLVFGKGVL